MNWLCSNSSLTNTSSKQVTFLHLGSTNTASSKHIFLHLGSTNASAEVCRFGWERRIVVSFSKTGSRAPVEGAGALLQKASARRRTWGRRRALAMLQVDARWGAHGTRRLAAPLSLARTHSPGSGHRGIGRARTRTSGRRGLVEPVRSRARVGLLHGFPRPRCRRSLRWSCCTWRRSTRWRRLRWDRKSRWAPAVSPNGNMADTDRSSFPCFWGRRSSGISKPEKGKSQDTNIDIHCHKSREKLRGTRSQYSVSLGRTFLVAIDKTGSFTDCISDRNGRCRFFFLRTHRTYYLPTDRDFIVEIVLQIRVLMDYGMPIVRSTSTTLFRVCQTKKFVYLFI
jgi:hypothetical protein